MEQDLASEPSSINQKKKTNTWKILTIVFILLFIAALFTRGFTILNVTGKAALSKDDAKAKADDFIQKYIVLPGITINIDNIAEESGLYRIDITATSGDSTENAKAYLSKDGKLFFLQAIPLDDVDSLLQQQQAQQQPVVELEPPVVELEPPA